MKNNNSIVLPVFLASVSLLLFEMVQIRVFSYSLPPVLAYTGISIAMVGFGIGAMLTTLFPQILNRDSSKFLAVLCLLQATAMMLSCIIFARTSWNIILELPNSIPSLIFAILIPFTLPYLFMGLFISIIFSRKDVEIGKIYFWNLLGSGIGCILIVLFIRIIGAEKLVTISALLSALAGLILTIPKYRKTLALSCCFSGILLISLAVSGYLFPFSPDPVDAVGFGLRFAKQDKLPMPEKEFDEWNIVGKIEVWNSKIERVQVPETLDLRILTVDSGASTQLLEQPEKESWGKDLFEDTSYGMAYRVKPNPEKVLIIGSGGGIDVHTALHWNAKDITAVEINSSTIRAVSGPYASFLKWPNLSDRISIVHADGRGFVKSTTERYDVVQMTGVDTMTVYATGSINMAEEYLYTIEAFQDYLSVLKPQGILAVLRYGTEYIRLTAIATEALLKHGVANPSKNIVAFRQSNAAGVIVKKQPFTSSELDVIEKVAARRTRNKVIIPHFEKWNFYINDPIDIIYAPGRVTNPAFKAYFNKVDKNSDQLKELYKEIIVPTDDNPYYMLSAWMTAKVHPSFHETFKVLKTFWISIVILAFALILLPVAVIKRRITSKKPMLWVLPYFCIIGLCFMLLEIGIIHHFITFVGSPGASIAAVLASLLVSSGIGSYTSEYITKKPLIKIFIAGIVLVLASLFVLLLSKPLFNLIWEYGWNQPLRGIAAGIMIAPMGFAMGWFFPLGLKTIHDYYNDSNLIPWAVSINGFASVLGSVSALPFSMKLGFNRLFIIAILGYSIAVALSLACFGISKKMMREK